MKVLSVICVGLLCLCCLTAMVSCGQSNDPVETTPTTTPPTTPTTAAIIKEDLTDMISAEELSAALDVEMTNPSLSGQGTVLTSIGVEQKVTLNVEVSEKPREIFDQVLLSYPVAVPCPNLGETAWYSSIYHQLLVYDNGYMMTVEVFGLDKDADGEMISCRQIAALMLEHLSQISK